MTDQRGLHKPGYRISVKMATDHAARETLADAYQSYEDDLCNRYKNPAPGPLTAILDAEPIIDEEFDDTNFDDADLVKIAYEMYDAEISGRWKGE